MYIIHVQVYDTLVCTFCIQYVYMCVHLRVRIVYNPNCLSYIDALYIHDCIACIAN